LCYNSAMKSRRLVAVRRNAQVVSEKIKGAGKFIHSSPGRAEAKSGG